MVPKPGFDRTSFRGGQEVPALSPGSCALSVTYLRSAIALEGDEVSPFVPCDTTVLRPWCQVIEGVATHHRLG